MFQRMVEALKSVFSADKSIWDELTAINVRRILYFAPITATLNGLYVLFFSVFRTGAGGLVWRQRLIFAHGGMLLYMLICFFIAFYLRNKPMRRSMNDLLKGLVMVGFAAGGIAIVTIDQLVTANITPFLLTSLIVATGLLNHPLHSLAYYSVVFAAYSFFIGLSHSTGEVLSSNRINGFATTAFCFVLSVVLWRHHYTGVRQRRHIDNQRVMLEDANRKLSRMAYYDSLTGLPNRQHFDQVLQKEISRNSRKGYTSYLIMLDIDLFKNINDMYGHPIGDALLIEIGELLLNNIRKYDTLARLGGEEFLLLLPQTGCEDALAVAEKLRHILEAHAFCIKDHIIHVTASFGVSRLSYTSDPQLIAQYAEVDNALYRAKQCGRNCIKIA